MALHILRLQPFDGFFPSTPSKSHQRIAILVRDLLDVGYLGVLDVGLHMEVVYSRDPVSPWPDVEAVDLIAQC